MKEKELKKEINWLLREKYNTTGSGPVVLRAAKRDIKRLKGGEPIDYLIGFTEFLGTKIDLSQKPMIPRTETEYWVEKAVEVLKKNSKNKEVECLDVFAGPGCIGIAILRTCPELCRRIDFAEKNKKFLKQIKINLKINKINKNRCRVINSDIFSKIRKRYDYIFANPPYVPAKNKEKVQKSVLKWEPKSAIFGGKDGLFFIKKFLKEAKDHLKKEGKIYLEFDPPQKKDIKSLVKKYGYSGCSFSKDQYNKWRCAVIKF